MSCKSALYGANTASQTILAAGSVISFGSVVRRFGCGLNLSGGNVAVTGSGYYDVDVNLTVTPSAEGTATVQVYKDGVAVPGAETTFTAAAASTYSVCIPALIRETCNCEDIITVMITGVAGTVSNAAVVVSKL